jgi:NADH dehydrogenase
MDKTLPHVVIIGAGFGGLWACGHLKNSPVRITLVDKVNHHLFQPLLYQVALAALSPAEIASPIRGIVKNQKNTSVLLDTVTAIDLKNHLIKTDNQSITYDYLILASGAKNNYFGNDQWEEVAPGLKNLAQALEIRRRVLLAFEKAENLTNKNRRSALMTFVVIGGGATGVEMAGSLAEMCHTSLVRDFRNIHSQSAKVILIEGSNRVLSAFPENLSRSAEDQLKHLGVEVKTEAMVADITTNGVSLKDGSFIPAETVFWCAGVKATEITSTLGVPLDRADRVIVEKDLSIPGYKNTFAIGDAVSFTHQTGYALPGVAPVAMQEGECVAKSIKNLVAGKESLEFHYFDKGSLATIGRSKGIADLKGLQLTGLLAEPPSLQLEVKAYKLKHQ